MFEQLKKQLFSTKLTAVLLFLFLAVLAFGTFFESYTDTPTAQRIIYRTHWLELILFLLGINLLGNIVKYKLYRKEKFASFLFHISFIVIIIGAAFTRYIGYEGYLHIREGETRDVINSRDMYFQFKVHNDTVQKVIEKEIIPIKYVNNFVNNYLANDYFDYNIDFLGEDIRLTYNKFIPNSIDTLIEDPTGAEFLEIVTTDGNGRISVFLEDGESRRFGTYIVSYNNPQFTDAINITRTDSGLMAISPYDIKTLSMDTKQQGVMTRDSLQHFAQRTLYTLGETNMVLKNIIPHGRLEKITSSEKGKGIDAMVVNVEAAGDKREVYLFGSTGSVSKKTIFQLGDNVYEMSFGAKPIKLPFAIRLNDFELLRYPGSMSPSSYSSRVTVIDDKNNKEFDHHIYMNNVLDYQGFRFFQSSFDPDELGSQLSVNHDRLGTNITYFGYALMMLAMFANLFTKKTRFGSLVKKLIKYSKKTAVIILLLGTSLFVQAQEEKLADVTKDVFVTIPKAEASKFGHVILQDKGGRMKPINTFASEILRKIARKSTWKDSLGNKYTPEQVLLGFLYNPKFWLNEKIIKIGHPKLALELGATDNYVAFNSFFNDKFEYKFSNTIQEALRTPEKDRSKYEKEILLVDERVNVIYLLTQGKMLNIFPMPDDSNNKWYNTTDYEKFPKEPGLLVKGFLYLYLTDLDEGMRNNNDFTKADSTLQLLVNYQRKIGEKVMPSKSKINLEITYNKMNFFNYAFESYFILSLILLVLIFFNIINDSAILRKLINITTFLIFLTFIYHTIGLGVRWYVSGHAPWSSAYEVLTYIAWTTMIAGFIFVRRLKIVLAAATLMASLTLLVSMLNWLNPDIGPLVPVLKSYWLTIHVAIMSGSYGFLGVSALLGLMIMFLYIVMNPTNKTKLTHVISELTIINELLMTIGVFMAAIGTFLGGIWANESWGRYWGWDPKETWALIIVLAYAIVLHLRLIPGLKSKFTFNVWAILTYSTVLMTFFGVNYFLVGLHSYAGGGTPEIPAWTYLVFVVIVAIILLANYKRKKLKQKTTREFQ